MPEIFALEVDEQDDALALWPEERRLGTSYFTEWEADETVSDIPTIDRSEFVNINETVCCR